MPCGSGPPNGKVESAAAPDKRLGRRTHTTRSSSSRPRTLFGRSTPRSSALPSMYMARRPSRSTRISSVLAWSRTCWREMPGPTSGPVGSKPFGRCRPKTRRGKGSSERAAPRPSRRSPPASGKRATSPSRVGSAGYQAMTSARTCASAGVVRRSASHRGREAVVFASSPMSVSEASEAHVSLPGHAPSSQNPTLLREVEEPLDRSAAAVAAPRAGRRLDEPDAARSSGLFGW